MMFTGKDEAAATRKSFEDKIAERALWCSAQVPSTGRTYWYHSVTHLTQWSPPAIVDELASEKFKTAFAKAREDLAQLSGAPSAPDRGQPVSDSHSVLTCKGGNSNGIDLSQLVIAKKSELKDAIESVNKLMADKNLALNPTTSCHFAFARKVPDVASWHRTILAMGIRIIDIENDKNAEYILPYTETNSSAVATPSLKVMFSTMPPIHVTLEYIPSSRRAYVRGGRAVVLQRLPLLIGFFGRISEVNAQAAPPSTSKKSAKKTNTDPDPYVNFLEQLSE